jgi:hypothetical protein
MRAAWRACAFRHKACEYTARKSPNAKRIKRIMRRKSLSAIIALTLIAAMQTAVLAADNEEDTDTRLVSAKVVEVTDGRISVIARTGVEHVIAIDDKDTKVKVEGKLVSLKDVREGDMVTVELDELNPVKFARNIQISNQSGSQVARAKP